MVKKEEILNKIVEAEKQADLIRLNASLKASEILKKAEKKVKEILEEAEKEKEKKYNKVISQEINKIVKIEKERQEKEYSKFLQKFEAKKKEIPVIVEKLYEEVIKWLQEK